MLTVSAKQYAELQRIHRRWKAGKISKAQCSRLTNKILNPIRKKEELREKLREIDPGYSRRDGFFVQGGLPSLGKRR